MAEQKTNVMRLLDQKKIKYTAREYPHSDAPVDGVTAAALMGQDPARVFKTLVARGASKKIYVFDIPAAAELDLAEAGALHFYRQDEEAFPSTNLARRALAKGSTATAAFNAADEIAVAAFLEGKIKFTDIPRIIEKTIEMEFTKGNSFDEVFYTDCEARKFASELVR